MARIVYFLFCLSLLITGCSANRPALTQNIKPPEKYLLASSDRQSQVSLDHWWESLGDKELNNLVQELLSSNFRLQEAAAKIKAAEAFLKETRAARFPRLDFSFSAKRERQPVYSLPVKPSITGSFSGSLMASYEVDVWQRLSHAKKASYYQLMASQENRRALVQSLIAQLVSEYVSGAYLSCEKAILEEQLEIQRRYLGALRKRYRLGLVEPFILEQEERLLASLEEEKERLEGEIITARQKISLLLGKYPKPWPISANVCRLEIPPPPAGLPSELLERRPDVLAARARLLSASEQVASEKAALFPKITLTAQEGRVSNALVSLLNNENRFWELALSLTQPIFDAGARKARVKEAQARFKEAQAVYAQTVLQAFFEVENALMLENNWRKRLELSERQEKAACNEEKLKSLQAKLGTISILDYLKIKHLCLERKRKTLSTKKNLLLARISLFRALGGGF
ncbi:efflux transporter outer membrane subunit [Thermodesulfatator indicus]